MEVFLRNQSLLLALLLQILSLVAPLILTLATVIVQGYDLDSHKLEQRYDLIQRLVAAGVPRKVSGGGGHHVQRGHHKKNKHYYSPSATYAADPKFGSLVSAVKNSDIYRPQKAYSSYPQVGYNTRYVAPSYGSRTNYGYGQYVNPYQNAYGYRNNIPNYRSGIVYKPGGGAYHPSFDNKNIYQPKNFGDVYGTDPIYLGGSEAGYVAPAKVVVPAKAVVAPLPASYPASRPVAKDAIGGTYTGQTGTLYGDLPGYTNKDFSVY